MQWLCISLHNESNLSAYLVMFPETSDTWWTMDSLDSPMSATPAYVLTAVGDNIVSKSSK